MKNHLEFWILGIRLNLGICWLRYNLNWTITCFIDLDIRAQEKVEWKTSHCRNNHYNGGRKFKTLYLPSPSASYFHNVDWIEEDNSPLYSTFRDYYCTCHLESMESLDNWLLLLTNDHLLNPEWQFYRFQIQIVNFRIKNEIVDITK